MPIEYSEYFTLALRKIKISRRRGLSQMQNDMWIPILDYAVLRGISTSTLRRYIKAKKVEYKVENGRYLLLADPQTASQYAKQQSDLVGGAGSLRPLTRPMLRSTWNPNYAQPSQAPSKPQQTTEDGISVFTRVRELEEKLLQAEEQISELSMLVAIYEEKLAQSGH
jgi:hypothetical protein